MRGPALAGVAAGARCVPAQPDRDLRALAMRLRYRLIAAELAAVGINVNCAPVLDLAGPETHAVILNRATATIRRRSRRWAVPSPRGSLAGGVLPVMKHMPGQGRAAIDSHLALPRVQAPRAELAADFAPFRALRDLPMAMTAHVVYDAIDPERPATQSPAVDRG